MTFLAFKGWKTRLINSQIIIRGYLYKLSEHTVLDITKKIALYLYFYIILSLICCGHPYRVLGDYYSLFKIFQAYDKM